jgi:hypothetical protein|tara:strand:- start:372 stop:557 length:186 start_codon:yes stop_codon:yes gene_type:complete
MKNKKQVTEEDLEFLERHIQSTKLRLIDTQNRLNNAIAKMKGISIVFFIVVAIILIIGYII